MKTGNPGTGPHPSFRWSRIYAPAGLALASILAVVFTTALFTTDISRADGPPNLGTAFTLPIALEQGRPAPALASSGPRQPGVTPAPLPTAQPPVVEVKDPQGATPEPEHPTLYSTDGAVPVISAYSPATTQILIHWNEPAGNVDGYELQVSKNGSSWRLLAGESTLSGPRGTLYNYFHHGGLGRNQTRHYRLRARYGTNWSDWSNSFTATTGATNAPSLSVEAINTRTFRVSWERTADSIDPQITGWEIQIAEDAPMPYGSKPWMTITTLGVDEMTYTRTVPLPGITRYFRVRATTANGPGAWSRDDIHATTFLNSAPSAPGLTAQPDGASGIILSWSKPSGRGFPITGYDLQESPDGRHWRGLGPAWAEDTRLSVYVEEPGTTRYFRIRAKNTEGLGYWSRAVRGTSDNGGAGPIVGLEVVNFGATSTRLTWQAPEQEEGDSPITGYQVQRTASDGLVSWRNVGSTGPSTLTFEDTRVEPGTLYHYRVAARDGGGLGPWASTYANVITKSLVPDAPRLTARAMSRQLENYPDKYHRYEVWVDLEWTEPDDNGAPIHGYYLQSSPNGRDNWEDLEGSAGLGPLLGKDQTLTNGETRYYRVQAANRIGDSPWSNVARVTTRGVAPPAPPIAHSGPPLELKVSESGSRVELTWQAPEQAGDLPITGYQVQRIANDGSDSWRNVGSTGPTTLTFRDTTVEPGTLYHYRVAARDRVGLGPWTEEGAYLVTKALPPDAPRLTVRAMCRRGVIEGDPPCISAPNQDSARPQVWIELEWTEPESNGAIISDYLVERSSNGRDGWEPIPGFNVGHFDAEDYDAEYGETWHYRVQTRWYSLVAADDQPGQALDNLGPWSNVARATTRTFVPGPLPDLEKGPPLDKQIQLDWEPPYDDGGRPVTGYRIQVSTRGHLGQANWSTVASLGKDSRTYTHRDLRADTEYCYRIQARNSLGLGSWGSIVKLSGQCFRLTPAAPALNDFTTGEAGITVSWTKPDSLGLELSGYELGIAANSLFWNGATLTYDGESARSATFTKNEITVTYLKGTNLSKAFFRVRATATNGTQSDWSEAKVVSLTGP